MSGGKDTKGFAFGWLGVRVVETLGVEVLVGEDLTGLHNRLWGSWVWVTDALFD